MTQLSPTQVDRQSVQRKLWEKSRSIVSQQVPLLVLVVLFIFASLRYDNFFSPYNLTTFFSAASMLALLALGQTFVIISGSGGIDISVGSVVALSAVLAARFSSYGLYAALGVVLLVGALIGLINGLAITRLRIPPFIATLAMLTGVRGLALLASGEATLSADSTTDFTTIFSNNILGIPIPVWIIIIAFAIGSLVLNYTRFGRHVLAIGGNEDAARLLGLPVDRIKLLVYIISGMLASLAGLLLAAQTFSGNPNEAVGWELNAIAAVIVGGTLLTGGKGTVFGSLVGALLLALIFNVLNFESGYGAISLSSYWETVIRGAFLFIVVILQVRLTNRKKTVQAASGITQAKSA